jgi:hypothetical protein
MGCAAQKENEAKIYNSSGKEKQLRHGMEDLHCNSYSPFRSYPLTQF